MKTKLLVSVLTLGAVSLAHAQGSTLMWGSSNPQISNSPEPVPAVVPRRQYESVQPLPAKAPPAMPAKQAPAQAPVAAPTLAAATPAMAPAPSAPKPEPVQAAMPDPVPAVAMPKPAVATPSPTLAPAAKAAPSPVTMPKSADAAPESARIRPKHVVKPVADETTPATKPAVSAKTPADAKSIQEAKAVAAAKPADEPKKTQPKPAAEPQQAAYAPMVADEWSFKRGSSIKEIMTAWSAKAQWQAPVWDDKVEDMVVQADATFTGDFMTALKKFIDALPESVKFRATASNNNKLITVEPN